VSKKRKLPRREAAGRLEKNIFILGMVVVTLTNNQLIVIVGFIVILLATLTFGFVYFSAEKTN
jgi:hypothetical protein